MRNGDNKLNKMSRAFAVTPPGTTCDCGRYRKVVGQLDATIGKLRSAVKFVKAGEQQTRQCQHTPQWRLDGCMNWKLSV